MLHAAAPRRGRGRVFGLLPRFLGRVASRPRSHNCFLGCTAQGTLLITTEFGLLRVAPGEVAVIQRGMRFSVALTDGPARGYVLEASP